MPEDEWLLVEIMGPEPTVVADGGQRRDWTSPWRARAGLGPVARRLITDAVRAASERSDAELVLADSGMGVVAVPVRCAFGTVHGVQIWAGRLDAMPPPRRRVACWDWNADTQLAHHGPGLEELIFARAPEDVRVIRTPPEAFGRMVRFDDRLAYFGLVQDLKPGSCFQGEVDMLGDDGTVRHFQMITRVHPDGEPFIRALMHEMVVPSAPSTELTMLRAASRALPNGVGLTMATGLVYEWVREPPPPLDRWATELPEIHPDDVEAYRAAHLSVVGGAERDGTVLRFRVRFPGTEWIAVGAELAGLHHHEPSHGMLRVWPEPLG
ncbi:GAF domain-containing protein [Nocardia terpenica]|uniref:Rv3651-like N-terminal domain-containing protein n=1 Tax=Nocardia terpenica TaxID=455432 RepID=A0A6G9ZAY9_9NOCA|nr:GAF domain-containing protein [Nocardia terpenica]QIS22765.1 hypothetical protein F6W96_34935 [Nocardia terpenica]